MKEFAKHVDISKDIFKYIFYIIHQFKYLYFQLEKKNPMSEIH